jgi:hypothetical protein
MASSSLSPLPAISRPPQFPGVIRAAVSSAIVASCLAFLVWRA